IEPGEIRLSTAERTAKRINQDTKARLPKLTTGLTKRQYPHSTEFSGGTPTPFVIPLKLCSLTPILGHHLQRPSDQRVTHAQHRSPDPRKPDDHHRFPERSHLLSVAW